MQQIPDTDEYKLCKRYAKPEAKAKPHFRRFEDLVSNIDLKRKCDAVRTLMGPVAVALHYHEGDNVPISHAPPCRALYPRPH